MSRGPSRGIERREFVKAAVAIGGTSALSACLDRELATLSGESATNEFPGGTDPGSLPVRQHAWNDYLVRNAHGNTTLPNHQLVLGLSYEGSTPPTDAEREQVETALATLDRACQWGTGGDEGASINEGLFSMIGYAPRYFERLGGSVDLMTPEEVLSAVDEDPAKTDGFDALLVLNSDWGSLVLAAEAALFGERETINGVDVAATFEGVFSKAGRRSGVVGKGLPAKELDRDDVPEEAPLSMGFRSGFLDNQAPEDVVSIEEGPFAGGTTIQASRLRIDLDRWYDNDTEERVAGMFCPAHDPEEIGDTGENLGSNSRITAEDVENIPEHAEEYDRIGHSQKVATARNDEFTPRILRRTEAVATDATEGVEFNFQSLQQDMDAFVDARKAMSVDEYDVDVPDEDHGIVDYVETVARGTFLVPPRDRRALPTV